MSENQYAVDAASAGGAFTKTEETVLAHYFTSTDRSVRSYGVTDAMPSQLWAFLIGGYSRSHLGLRERFLHVFREYAESINGSYDVVISELADALDVGGAVDNIKIKYIMDKATKFMSKWAVQYGHNSLKDSAQDRMVVDYISIRGAKVLEESRLCGAQERSTRYVDFRTLGFVCPPLFHDNVGGCSTQGLDDDNTVNISRELSYVTKATALHAKCIAVYTEILDAAIEHYRETLNPADFVSETAFANTARAKAFDTARYTLLTCLPTALGITMPTRETERRLSSWLASPHDEIVRVAQQLHNACLVNNDGLLRHVKPSSFEHETIPSNLIDNAFRGISETVQQWTSPSAPMSGVGTYDAASIKSSVSLHMPCTYSDRYGFLYQLAASLLKRCSGTNISAAVIEDHLRENKRHQLAWEVIRARLANRKAHDELPEEFAIGDFTASIEIDYGAFRDLQRHRNGTLVCSELDCSFGFMVPELLTIPKFAALHTSYCEYMQEVAEFHAYVRAFNPAVAEYWFALGHKVHFDYSCDFRQLIYICELRSQPAGHYSYRLVAQELFRQLARDCFTDGVHLNGYSEEFMALFNVDLSDPFTGSRAASENRAEAKLAALKNEEK